MTKPRRQAWMTTCTPMWLLHLLCVSLCVASANADEVDAKVGEINDTLRKSRVKAVAKALEDMRVVAADLVKKGDPRKDQVLARIDELARELDEPLSPDQLRALVKEFEAIEDRGGWWWLDQNNPNDRKNWYRLDRIKKRLVYWNKDANGKPVVDDKFCATYQVIGVTDADENIILVKVTYLPQGTEQGNQDIFRFDKRTGVLHTTYDCYGKPK